jgi:hypothetical protein
MTSQVSQRASFGEEPASWFLPEVYQCGNCAQQFSGFFSNLVIDSLPGGSRPKSKRKTVFARLAILLNVLSIAGGLAAWQDVLRIMVTFYEQAKTSIP